MHEAVAAVIFVILSVIVGISVIFEKCRELLMERVDRHIVPIVNSLFSELTLLGFIGLVMFFIVRARVLDNLSVHLFDDEDTLQELIETIHMVLFGLMGMFLLLTLLLARIGSRLGRRWAAYESAIRHQALAHYSERRAPTSAPLPSAGDSQSLDLYTEIRRRFIHERGTPAVGAQRMLTHQQLTDGFEFSEYLGFALGHLLAEIVEVPVMAWIALEGVFVLLFGVMMAPRQWLVVIAFGFGLALSLAIAWMRRHLLLQRQSFAPAPTLPACSLNGDPAAEADESAPLLAHPPRKPSDISHGHGHLPHAATKHGFHRVLFLYRQYLLLTSLYIAVVLSLIVEDTLRWRKLIPGLPPSVEWLMFLPLAIPPVAFIACAEHTLSALVELGAVGELRDDDICARVVRLMKTKKALSALKVLAMLRMKTADAAPETTTQIPRPVDTQGIVLSPEAGEAVPLLAAADHEAWRQHKAEAGWVYGPIKDEAAKTHPDLRPFAELAPSAQAYNLGVNEDTVKVIQAMGYRVRRRADTPTPHLVVPAAEDREQQERPALTHLVALLAANNHQTWAHAQLDKGWKYGTTASKSRCESPLLLPFEQLPLAEQKRARAAASSVLDAAIDQGFCFERVWETPMRSSSTSWADQRDASTASLFSTMGPAGQPQTPRTTSRRIRRDELRRAFELFSQSSGRIINADILPALESLGLTVNKTDAMAIVRQMDAQGLGAVTYANFCRWVLEHEVASEADDTHSVHQIIQNAFRIIDRDGSGEITASELMESLQTMGEAVDFDDAQAILMEADRDGDGRINLEEFAKLMSKVLDEAN